MKRTSASEEILPQSEAPCTHQHDDCSNRHDEAATPPLPTLSDTLALWISAVYPASLPFALAESIPAELAAKIAGGKTPAKTATATFRAHYLNARTLFYLEALVPMTGGAAGEPTPYFAAIGAEGIAQRADRGLLIPPALPPVPADWESRIVKAFSLAVLERDRQAKLHQRMLDAPVQVLEELAEARATVARASALAAAPGRGW